MIEKLLAEHDGLREALAAIRAIVAHGELPDMTQLADARWRLASRTMQHLASEDRHVYAVLGADPRVAVAAIGRRFQDDYAGAMADYAEHTRRWTPERIAADWAGYRARTTALIDGMMARIAREERELFPAARLAQAEAGTACRSGLNWAREAFAMKDNIRPAARA